MSKQLYEEALADAKRLKEVAEDNARRTLIEAVTPRIRDLIEKELLKEHGDFDDDDDVEVVEIVSGAPGTPDKPGDLVTDTAPVGAVPAAGDGGTAAAAISVPDAEGKVTLDLDALATDPIGAAVPAPVFGQPTSVDGDEYELSLESVEALTPVAKATKSGIIKELEAGLYRLGEQLQAFKAAHKVVKESRGYSEQITHMISRVENMYDYVQEAVTDPARKSSYEAKLETYFKELSKLQEQKMSKKSLKDLMNEGDVTLKLTGLPDEIDLDSVGVDLITGEDEDGEGGEDLDLGAGEEGGEEGDEEGGEDMDLGDLDMGGEDQGQDDQMESRRLSDDTIVEIDESMLRREIARMKSLREDAVPSTKGAGVDAVIDQFGGGKSEGDPWLDGEVTTESDEGDEDDDQLDEIDGELTMDEGDDDQDDDQLDETDFGMDQAEDSREAGGNVAPASMGPGAESGKESREPGATMEALKRRVGFEKRLQERIKTRAAALKKEATRATAKKDSRKVAALKKEHAALHGRFTESVMRVKKMTKTLAEVASRNGARLNGSPIRPAEGKADANLRNKLAETNLFNAKLVFTNKLLQNEALSRKQKAEIIERLDEAKSLREAKLIYESLTKTLAGTSRPLVESAGRKVIGSASRATRPASTKLDEGYETDRWARLAGIK
jgi:hypothetical protein